MTTQTKPIELYYAGTPNGRKIGADKAGVAVSDRGFIPVDIQMRTNVPHIFAIGDIVGQPMLAHKAVHEAHVAAEVAAGQKAAFDARVIPSVAYTDPEVAWVGLTEEQAKAEGRRVKKGLFPWTASGRLLVGHMSDEEILDFIPREDFQLPNGAWLPPETFIAEVRAATRAGEFTFNSIVDSFTHCFAVPVKGTDDRTIATLCLVAPRDDGLRHRQEYLDSLKQAAAELHYKSSGRTP